MDRKIKDHRLINNQGMMEFRSFERDSGDLDDLVDGFWMPDR
ncbi:hypothetical protein [Desulfolucanica intricata]|nr:hypothetical protein [Desulfolucanica intricata]